MKNILFIPIDNRPITYSLTGQIANIYKSSNLFMPKRTFLGGLYDKAKIEDIFNWLETAPVPNLMVISLDTLAYGGLVSSRRCPETFEEILDRLNSLKKILLNKKEQNKNLKIFATSSIMRISNNNINEEEKPYWNVWGEEIFRYSYNFHKNGGAKTPVPSDILHDYLQTRERNFKINKVYLEWLSLGIFDFLIFSKDDTGEFGLNVIEAQKLEQEIKSKKLNAIIKTGADEIPLGLLTRGFLEGKNIKIKPIFAYEKSTDLVSRYEDISVQKCVEAQILIMGAKIEHNFPDIILYVNNFEKTQGDFIFRDVLNSNNEPLPEITMPVIFADINNANGADPSLIEKIFKRGYSTDFLSYSGYNTSANSIGSALSMGITAYLAKKEGTYSEIDFKKLLAIRFLDDWGYQAFERKNYPEINMIEYERKVKEFLKFDFEASYTFPWNRSFEIEVKL